MNTKYDMLNLIKHVVLDAMFDDLFGDFLDSLFPPCQVDFLFFKQHVAEELVESPRLIKGVLVLLSADQFIDFHLDFAAFQHVVDRFVATSTISGWCQVRLGAGLVAQSTRVTMLW